MYLYITYIYYYYNVLYVFTCIGYSPAYNTHEIIGRGRSPRQLSQGCP